MELIVFQFEVVFSAPLTDPLDKSVSQIKVDLYLSRLDQRCIRVALLAFFQFAFSKPNF